MPYAFSVYRALEATALDVPKRETIAGIVQRGRSESAHFSHEIILNELFDCGFDESIADVLVELLRNCFVSQRYSTHFSWVRLKASLVRAGLGAPKADALLHAIHPAIVTPQNSEVRVPVKYCPAPGRIVMCDFRFLSKPEMQKERRAIVLSKRVDAEPGRCTVVPVSMSPARGDNSFYYEFAPGLYQCFHKSNPVWAVCDHIYTVSLARMWKVNVQHRPCMPALSEEDLKAIRTLVGTALGL